MSDPANIDGAVVKFLAGLVGIVSAVGVWLAKAVVSSRDRILQLEGRVEHLEKKNLTTEDVRGAIKSEMDQREKQSEKLSAEREKRLLAELKATITEGCLSMVPHIVKEVKGSTGFYSPPQKHPPDSRRHDENGH